VSDIDFPLPGEEGPVDDKGADILAQDRFADWRKSPAKRTSSPHSPFTCENIPDLRRDDHQRLFLPPPPRLQLFVPPHVSERGREREEEVELAMASCLRSPGDAFLPFFCEGFYWIFLFGAKRRARRKP